MLEGESWIWIYFLFQRWGPWIFFENLEYFLTGPPNKRKWPMIYRSVKIYQRVFPWSSLSPSSCQCGVSVWQTWKYNKYVNKYILFKIEVNIIQLLHLNLINMRFYGTEYTILNSAKEFNIVVVCSGNKSKHNNLNDLMWDWFHQARDKAIPLSGTILQSKALEFASLQLLHLNLINMRFYGTEYTILNSAKEFNIVVVCSIKPHINQVQV
jgi:hypothetical protein